MNRNMSDPTKSVMDEFSARDFRLLKTPTCSFPLWVRVWAQDERLLELFGIPFVSIFDVAYENFCEDSWEDRMNLA